MASILFSNKWALVACGNDVFSRRAHDVAELPAEPQRLRPEHQHRGDYTVGDCLVKGRTGGCHEYLPPEAIRLARSVRSPSVLPHSRATRATRRFPASLTSHSIAIRRLEAASERCGATQESFAVLTDRKISA
jgi:hypothetical protein